MGVGGLVGLVGHRKVYGIESQSISRHLSSPVSLGAEHLKFVQSEWVSL